MSIIEDSLPHSWIRLSLGDAINYGRTSKAEPNELADDTWVLELEDIEKDTGRVLQRLTYLQRQSKSTKNRFFAGDVLYGKLRPYLNKVVYADSSGVCTTEIVPIRPTEAVDGRYLLHWLRHPQFLSYVTEVSHGVNMPRLGTDAGKAAPFVLAPKLEQRRIADKLDAVLARVEAVTDRLARVSPLLKRFRQSVLKAATSGSLTKEWRMQQSGVACWKNIFLVDEAEDFGYGSAAKSSKAGDVPVLRMGNIQSGELDWKDLVFTSDQNEIAKYELHEGDVLFNRTNSPELVGKSAIFRGERKAIFAGYLIRVRCSEQLLPDFLNYNLCSPAGREYCRRVKSDGVSQSNINASKLRAFEFKLPGIVEQIEIVRRVELLFAFADRLEDRLKVAQTATARLTPSLLAKAFRGELVPQDPSDEPASELLRRLQANTTSGVSKRGRRTAE
ncbi:restriction endonuclease subunit S [Janthinobacterium sp. RB2R34]|uniref:restriction endonuclease subunit S n=1 Tax=Janthinobacterium sp. RB2R34 TaxID=3424193 RepID=UPI003F24AF56